MQPPVQPSNSNPVTPPYRPPVLDVARTFSDIHQPNVPYQYPPYPPPNVPYPPYQAPPPYPNTSYNQNQSNSNSNPPPTTSNNDNKNHNKYDYDEDAHDDSRRDDKNKYDGSIDPPSKRRRLNNDDYDYGYGYYKNNNNNNNNDRNIYNDRGRSYDYAYDSHGKEHHRSSSHPANIVSRTSEHRYNRYENYDERSRSEMRSTYVTQSVRYTNSNWGNRRSYFSGEARLCDRPLTIIGANSNGDWENVLYNERLRTFAGYCANPFDRKELYKYYKRAMDDIRWNRPHNSWGRGYLNRKTAWYVASSKCYCNYSYSKMSFKPYTFPDWLTRLTKKVLKKCNIDLDTLNFPNACNINWYKRSNDMIGWHSDNEYLFKPCTEDCIIISLSIGNTRVFEVKPKEFVFKNMPHKIDQNSDNLSKVVLNNGDLMTMEGLFQKYYLHRVPLQTKYEEDFCKKNNSNYIDDYNDKLFNRGRINFTWRWIKLHEGGCKCEDNKGPGHFKLLKTEKHKKSKSKIKKIEKTKKITKFLEESDESSESSDDSNDNSDSSSSSNNSNNSKNSNSSSDKNNNNNDSDE